MKNKHICLYQFNKAIKHMQNKCKTCSHAYPHAHTKECDGGHCPQSNPHYLYQDFMNNCMTCKPIEDKKNGFAHTMPDMKPAI